MHFPLNRSQTAVTRIYFPLTDSPHMPVGNPCSSLQIDVSVYFFDLVAGTYRRDGEDREKEREEEIRFLESLPLAGHVRSNAQETVGELTP